MRKILRIKSILKSRGLTMEDLANELGINKVSLSATLNGNPTMNTLEKIANTLNVPVVKLFHSVENEHYQITSTDFNNTITYNDDHIFLYGFLPHLTKEGGSFCLSMNGYNFSIVPNAEQISELVESEDIESHIFKGDQDGRILIQYCGTLTSLLPDEHLSFCSALSAFQKCYHQCLNEVNDTLGVLGFEKLEGRNEYQLGEIDKSVWAKLIQLTKKYDLDENRSDFEEFNATGNSIIMYDRSIRKGYNIKMWLVPTVNKYDDGKIGIAWRAPGGHNNMKLLSGEIFTASQSFKFLNEVLIPKAKKIK